MTSVAETKKKVNDAMSVESGSGEHADFMKELMIIRKLGSVHAKKVMLSSLQQADSPLLRS